MDSKTGRKLTEIDHIKQSITDILKTHKGSRLARRDYCCDWLDYIDAPATHENLLRIASFITTSITEWEPRVKVLNCDIQGSENAFIYFLTIAIKRSGEQYRFKVMSINK
ncbi:hypothetical protein A6A19_00895 [Actinobacillus delphinicola]|uniref:GPW/gp25 family protein n=1 Tax=Actinobacillus delphinicola TaxID=51161 RepID=UPI0024430286|nr:GPW/gp25 family protein [Actinobacillus delphinicola]MDG6896586.1 hypothetical protein [Actinobacillus delphinicola]